MADEPNTETETARFLAWLRPPGEVFPGVTLTAIPAEGGRTTTETHFDAKAGAGWMARFAGQQNCYYMVNPPVGAPEKKAAKTEVAAVAMLHVDIDPAKGGDWQAERERILASLEDHRPRPSAVIDSGNGFQALWRLRDPEPLTGLDDWARLEAYNRQLAIDLRGDSTFDVSRILRLPGLTNIPNQKKRDAGRVERPTSIKWLEDSAYDLADFSPAPLEHRSSGGVSAVSLTGDLPRADLDALPAAVSQRTRMLIVQGDDPDDATRYGSKSEVMWAVANELVRAGCDDDMIAAVLLEPDFGVSDHPLRQKRPVEYVARQIERAREENDHPLLHQMNEDHAVIEMYGGKCRVVSWQASEVDPSRLELVHQSFEDFRNRYMNVRVEVGKTKEGNPVYASAGKWWLENRMRRQYRNVVFRPGVGGDDAQDLNIWRGLAVAPRPGDWPLLRRLITEGLAGGDPAAADYIIRWSAHAVQHPEVPAEVALTLLGGKGTGKSTYGHIMRRIFGQHGISVAGSKAVTNNFNKHLHDCCLLFADEAVAPGDRAAAGIVKGLITDATILIEPKGLDAFPAPNHLKVVIASNDAYVVEASADERRYAVFNVSPHLAAPPGSGPEDERMTFWRNLNTEISGGGIEAFLYDLLDLDLGDWHPRYNVPQSGGLIAQKAASLRGFERVWYDALRTGIPPGLALPMGGGAFLLSTTGARDHCHKIQQQRTVELNDVAALLGEGRRDRNAIIRVPGMEFEKERKGNVRGHLVPGLAAARERWDAAKWPGEWGDEVEWELDEGYEDENGSPY